MEKRIQKLGVMLDCSRDAVYNVSALKRYIVLLEAMGYTSLQLYTEDTYSIGDPYFGYLRGRYTEDELKELDQYAKAHGIELIPCIQTLAHLSGYLRWNADVLDCNDILLAGHEPTYALIEKMFAACARCFTSRRINIGMDEAHMVGLGKYLERNGYENRFDIIRRHLDRVVEIAEKYGFQPMMWSDMFFRLANQGKYYCTDLVTIPEEVLQLVPENLQLVYWDYYSQDKNHFDQMLFSHKQFRNEILYAGGAWAWTGFVPHNEFSTRSNEVAIQSCLDNGVEEMVVTIWKDDGAESSLFSTIPCLFFTAKMAQGLWDRDMLEKEFNEFFGVPYSVFLAVENAELEGTSEIANPCKYMLYSDPFLGFLDWTVNREKKELFDQAQKQLQRVDSQEFGYLFDTLSALMDVMKDKYDLGFQLRSAYQREDREALQKLMTQCFAISTKVKTLHGCFSRQWMRECKPFGFEKHTQRLGGLAMRLEECGSRLKAYLDGEADQIPELKEEILPYRKDLPAGKAITSYTWMEVTAVKPNM